MKDNFYIVNKSSYLHDYSSADGEFWKKIGNLIGIGTGRRKQCNELGLTGSEKRDCVRKLKISGWKKGQPIPSVMSGITVSDVVEAEKYPPLATEVYVSPYQVDTSASYNPETGINQPMPYPIIKPIASDEHDSSWSKMSTSEKTITIVGVSAFVVVSGFVINRLRTRKNNHDLKYKFN